MKQRKDSQSGTVTWAALPEKESIQPPQINKKIVLNIERFSSTTLSTKTLFTSKDTDSTRFSTFSITSDDTKSNYICFSICDCILAYSLLITLIVPCICVIIVILIILHIGLFPDY